MSAPLRTTLLDGRRVSTRDFVVEVQKSIDIISRCYNVLRLVDEDPSFGRLAELPWRAKMSM